MRSRLRATLRYAFAQSLPVLCGYLFIGFAFGLLLRQTGYGLLWAVLFAGLVYAGSLQFLLVSFLAQSVPLSTVALMSLFINIRHVFYRKHNTLLSIFLAERPSICCCFGFRFREETRSMFFKKKKPAAPPPPKRDYERGEERPVLRCSICTGEVVAGFRNVHNGHFTEVQLIRTPEDLEDFKREYGIETLSKEY